MHEIDLGVAAAALFLEHSVGLQRLGPRVKSVEAVQRAEPEVVAVNARGADRRGNARSGDALHL